LLTARRLLAVIWGTGSLSLITLSFLLTVTRHASSSERSELWNWTLSWVVPPLTAILVTMRAREADKRKLTRRVDLFFVAFVVLLSACEILGVAIALVLELWVPAFDVVDFAKHSKGWAKSIQTLVSL